jgi:hypothetical protein
MKNSQNNYPIKTEPFYNTRGFYMLSGTVLGMIGANLFNDYVFLQNPETVNTNVCQVTETIKAARVLAPLLFGGFAGSIAGFSLDVLVNPDGHNKNEELDECP